MNIEPLLRRIIGFFLGIFSGNARCKHCGMPYWLVKRHTTWLGPIGITALCEHCFQGFNPEKRLTFYRMLRKVWQGSGSPDEYNWPLVSNAVRTEKPN